VFLPQIRVLCIFLRKYAQYPIKRIGGLIFIIFLGYLSKKVYNNFVVISKILDIYDFETLGSKIQESSDFNQVSIIHPGSDIKCSMPKFSRFPSQ